MTADRLDGLKQTEHAAVEARNQTEERGRQIETLRA
jgi:hypothetical protein